MLQARAKGSGSTRFGIFFGACLSVLAACTAPADKGTAPEPSKSDPSSPSNDVDHGTEPVDTTPKVCNSLSVDGLPDGTVEATTDKAPASAGGTLEDGTYVFVKAVMYGMSDAIDPTPFMKSKIVLAGSSAQRIAQAIDESSNEPPLSTTETFTVDGTMLTIATTCPENVTDAQSPFSVLEEGGKTELVIFQASEAGMIATYFEKE